MAANTNNTVFLPARGLDLPATLFCGQSFTWREVAPGVFRGVAGRRAVTTYMGEGRLALSPLAGHTFSDADIRFWQHYFALDVDYTQLCQRFCQDQTLAACVTAGAGLRLLHQPFWDALLSFILSQNNHIPRITSIVSALRTVFGPTLAPGLHGFPTPETLAALSPEALSPIRAGFRAKYLVDAARRVASGEVTEEKLAALSDADARALLMHIYGVGPKVADCVLLYGLGRTRVVPMDVWMKRAMQQLFPRGMPSQANGYEGIAQQFIFCWARTSGALVKESTKQPRK